MKWKRLSLLFVVLLAGFHILGCSATITRPDDSLETRIKAAEEIKPGRGIQVIDFEDRQLEGVFIQLQNDLLVMRVEKEDSTRSLPLEEVKYLTVRGTEMEMWVVWTLGYIAINGLVLGGVFIGR